MRLETSVAAPGSFLATRPSLVAACSLGAPREIVQPSIVCDERPIRWLEDTRATVTFRGRPTTEKRRPGGRPASETGARASRLRLSCQSPASEARAGGTPALRKRLFLTSAGGPVICRPFLA